MEFKDYYKILGVAENVKQDEIRKSYRRLARKYHPDVSQEKNAEERFKEIGEAYEVLRDEEKRAAYDNLRKGGWRGGQEFRPPPDWDPSAYTFTSGFTGDAGGFSDFFESLFGGLSGTRRQSGFAARPARGQDLRAKLDLDLEAAYQGDTRRLTLDGAQGQRTIQVKIPAGVRDGQTIRLRGQGAPGPAGHKGDLLLEVNILPHRLFQLRGGDLTLELPIAPWEAALGASVPVPTLDGEVKLKIPAGSEAGRKLRLRGRGLPGKPPGDQYVVLKLVTPRPESEQQRDLYRRMADAFDFDPRAGM